MKHLKNFLLVFAALFAFCACDQGGFETKQYAYFFVENQTDAELKIEAVTQEGPLTIYVEAGERGMVDFCEVVSDVRPDLGTISRNCKVEKKSVKINGEEQIDNLVWTIDEQSLEFADANTTDWVAVWK